MSILRAKLYDMEQNVRGEQDAARRSQIGTGERSEKIRTCNYPQSRVTDHRIGMTTHNLAAVLEGELTSSSTSWRRARVERPSHEAMDAPWRVDQALAWRAIAARHA